MALFVVIVLFLLFFSIEKPDFAFWSAVTIFLDPGGYVKTYLTRSMLGGLQITDLTFILLIIPLFSPKIKLSVYFKSKDNRWIIKFLFAFALIYHILIFGFIDTGGSFGALRALLQYQRLTIFGFFAVIPAYIFFVRNYPLLYKIAIITSFVLVIFYILRLGMGIAIVPFWEFERIRGSGIMRKSLLSYGYADWFIFISTIALLFKLRLPKKGLVYFIGIIMIIAVILTLTRRSIITLLFGFALVYIFRQKIASRSIVSPRIGKLLGLLTIVLVILFFTFPNYINYAISGLQDTFSIASKGGVDSRGEKDMRTVVDIPRHLARFRASPFFGDGWDPLWYSNKQEEGGMSANDVPLTAALGMFGIVGLFYYSLFYIKIGKILFQSFKVLKDIYRHRLISDYSILFAFCFLFIVLFTNKFTIGFMSYFADIIVGKTRVVFMLNLGFLLASRDLLMQALNSKVDNRMEC